MAINIIPCKVDQLNLLRQISMETYRDTFQDSNSDMLMMQYLRDALSTEKLLSEYKTTGSYFYFLYLNKEVAGFLKVNIDDAQSDDIAVNSLEIERFYICKSYLRQGLGRVLMRFAFELASELNKSSIWLGVWENNTRALAFYKALGFSQVGKHPFDMGGDIQADLVLKMDLKKV